MKLYKLTQKVVRDDGPYANAPTSIIIRASDEIAARRIAYTSEKLYRDNLQSWFTNDADIVELTADGPPEVILCG